MFLKVFVAIRSFRATSAGKSFQKNRKIPNHFYYGFCYNLPNISSNSWKHTSCYLSLNTCLDRSCSYRCITISRSNGSTVACFSRWLGGCKLGVPCSKDRVRWSTKRLQTDGLTLFSIGDRSNHGYTSTLITCYQAIGRHTYGFYFSLRLWWFLFQVFYL